VVISVMGDWWATVLFGAVVATVAWLDGDWWWVIGG